VALATPWNCKGRGGPKCTNWPRTQNALIAVLEWLAISAGYLELQGIDPPEVMRFGAAGQPLGRSPVWFLTPGAGAGVVRKIRFFLVRFL
jgi:hypothetical protein